MDANSLPRSMASPAAESKPDKQRLQPTLGFIPTQHLFAAVAVLLLALFRWPVRWFLSGAPFLSYSILLGAASGYHVLPFVPLWTLIAFINLIYSVAATSWLLYWVYLSICYPTIFFSCLYQFDLVARFVRKRLRALLRELQFINNKVAFFDLPALEIDVDVEGLMCIRGMSFSLSSLTIVAHGIEVGVKFSDDMEVAIVADTCTIKLFRRIDISDCFANVKGGQYEMTFGKLAKKTRNADGESIMVEDTPLLSAAAANGDTRRPTMMRLETKSMTDHMTGGKAPTDSSVKAGLQSVQQLSPDDEAADKQYRKLLHFIDQTSAITLSRKEVEQALQGKGEEEIADFIGNDNDMRAAICSQLHDKPTIPHPAKRSIKVSTIKNLTPPHIRKFLHRLPLLLRLLLNPIAYFHPVFIASITGAGSGKFIQHVLSEKVFPADSDTGIKNLKQRISAWLTDANFVFETASIVGQASVPLNTTYDIINQLTFDDVMAYRTLTTEVNLEQIVRLGGADARIDVPSFLLPHHEHLLPPVPTKADKQAQQASVDNADGKPKTLQAQHEMEQTMKDETNITISTHVRLPACFDQSLLDFITALVKATKLIESDKEENPVIEEEVEKLNRFKTFTKNLKADMKDSMTDLKDGMRRVAIDAAVNDKWIAKLVGKVTKKLETAQGDIGYSGEMPVPLEIYRNNAEPASKLMA